MIRREDRSKGFISMLKTVCAAVVALFVTVQANLNGTVLTEELPHEDAYVYVPPRNIPMGCARFYQSDPIGTEHGTRYWQLCTTVGDDEPRKFEIGQGEFSDLAHEHYGNHLVNSLSFISTGPDTWVEIFAERDNKGKSYEITPLADVDLSLVTDLSNPEELTFNDNVLSGNIRSRTSTRENPDSLRKRATQDPIHLWYKFVNVPRINVTDSGCGYFYDKVPVDSKTLLNGFVVCLTKNQHLAHINIKDMTDKDSLLKGMRNSSLIAIKPWTGDTAHKDAHRAKYLRSPESLLTRRLQTTDENVSDQEAPTPSSAPTESFFNATDELTGGWLSWLEHSFEDMLMDLEYLLEEGIEMFLGNGTETQIATQSSEIPESARIYPTEISSQRVVASPNAPDLSGIKYVEAGWDVNIALWNEDNFRGNQTIIPARSAVITEDYSVNSLFLISHKYIRNEPSASAAVKNAALQEKMKKAANLARKKKQQ